MAAEWAAIDHLFQLKFYFLRLTNLINSCLLLTVTIQRGSSGNGLALLGATEAAIENEDQQDRGLGVDANEVTVSFENSNSVMAAASSHPRVISHENRNASLGRH